jgi:hypothetical protein
VNREDRTCCALTSRCRRTVNDKVHITMGRRAAAELGRYIPELVVGTSGVLDAC